jgi:hypothetical protein
MAAFVIICLLAAGVLGGLAWRRQKADSEFKPAEKITPSNRKTFKSIEICPGSDSCQVAMDHAGKRILLEHSPRLPLDRCDRINDCNCTYINYSDRRAGDDRRNPYGSLSQAGAIGMRDANKRAGMDRRATTKADHVDHDDPGHDS